MAWRSVIGGAALVALAGAPASAAVFFTFDDPGTDLEVHYEQPGAGDTAGTMTYNAEFVDLVVDATDNGSGVLEFEAVLEFIGWEIGAITTNGPTTTAEVTGMFEFTDFNTGQTILTAEFDTGLVINALGAGSIITSNQGGLMYHPGPALMGVTDLIGFAPPQDAAFTLTDITFESFMTVIEGGQTFFGTFDANAAFTGTAQGIIPTPGAAILAAVGAVGLIPRRRRR